MTAWQAIREAPRRLGEAAAQARPQLRSIASPPRRMSSAAFAMLVVGLFMVGMVGNLVLATVLQSQAFAVREKQAAASELSYRASDLEAKVNRAEAPSKLGQRAAALGMVPNPRAVFIDLATGEVLGTPVPARGDEFPSLTRRAAGVGPLEGEVPPPATRPAATTATTVPDGPTAPAEPAQPTAPTEPSDVQPSVATP